MEASTTETTSAVNLDQLIADLDSGYERVPSEAIRAAREHRDLIVPRLIEVIREATAAARDGHPPEGDAHFYALFLLTEFQAKEALPAIVDALSLPGDLPFDLFGDAVTEIGRRVFATLAGDRPDLLDELARNRDVNLYVRWEAMDAFPLLFLDGRMTREEVVQRLKRQLTIALEVGESESDFISALVTSLCDVAPREAMTEIEEAFQRGLVDESWIDFDDVRECASLTEEEMLSSLKDHTPDKLVDTIAVLKGWASFSDRESDSQASRLPQLNPWVTPLLDDEDTTIRVTTPRVGRNDPCPCGSGKKFKKCCGAPN
jgi:hypothetical protein